MNFADRIKTAVGLFRGELPKSFSGIINKGNNARITSLSANPYNLIGWTFFALDKTAQRVGGIDLTLYDMNGRGDINELDDHEILSAIYRANPTMTKTDLFYITAMLLRIWGQAPWYVEFNGRRLMNIWPLRPDLLRINQNKSTGEILSYNYNVLGRSEVFSTDEIVFIRKPNPSNNLQGLSALFSAQLEIEADIQSAVWNRYLLENGADPGGILTSENELNDKTYNRLRDQWDARYGGAQNAGRTAILEAGIKYEKVAQNQKELDFTETRKFNRDTILTLLGVPTSLINDTANRANAETAERVFARDTIEPLMRLIVDQLNEFLVPRFGQNLWLDFEPPVGDDRETRRADIQVSLNTYKTINEVRDEENLPPLDGGDFLYMPFSNVPMIGDGATGVPANDPIVAGDTVPTTDTPPTEKNLITERYKQANGIIAFKAKESHNFTAKKHRQIKKAIKARSWRQREAIKIASNIVYEKVKSIINAPSGKLLIKGAVLKTGESKKKVSEMTDEEKASTLPKPIVAERKAYLKSFPKRVNNFKRVVKPFFSEQEKEVLDNLKKAGEPKSALGFETKGMDRAELQEKAKPYIDKILFDKKKAVSVLIKRTNPAYESTIEEGGRDVANLLGTSYEDLVATPATRDFMKAKEMKFADEVNATTIQALRDTLEEGLADGEGLGELGDRISDVFDIARGLRTETIARTEVGSALNFGRNAEMGLQGVESKRWLCIYSNSREAHIEADLQTVGINSTFEVDGEDLEYPQDPAGSAGNVINCQCSVSPVFD